MNDQGSGLSERELAELAALADGTLPPERRQAVEALVAASPELQDLVDRQRQSLAATQLLTHDPVAEPLRVSVEEQLATRRKRRPAARAALRLGLVASAAALAAVVILVVTGAPIAPTVAEAAQLAALSPTEPAPPPKDDNATQLALDVEGVAFPDLLRAFGWQAVGTRQSELDGREATTVFYEKGARQIAYVIVGGPGLSRPAGAEGTERDGVLFETLRVNDTRVVTWRRAGHTCVLVGDVPENELLALASWQGDGALGGYQASSYDPRARSEASALRLPSRRRWANLRAGEPLGHERGTGGS